MAQFKIAYQLTAAIEGGYVNDPDDNGGETYKGISRKWHPDWTGWSIIDVYKQSHSLKTGDTISGETLAKLVMEFYQLKFWDSNRLDEINDQDIANEIYDTGVNMSYKTAAKILQEALNLLNRNCKDYPDINVDGMIGKATLDIVNNHKYPRAIVKTLNVLQGARYVDLCKHDPNQEKFFRGWLMRA